MKHELPTILTCGLFDSKNKYPTISVTSPRKATHFELEYYNEDSDITVVNGVEYRRKFGSVLLVKPGEFRYSRLPFTCKYIRFRISDPFLLSKFSNINTYFCGANTKKSVAMFEEIFYYFYSENAFDKVVANAKLLLLLHYLSIEPSENRNAVSKCCKLIKNSYHEDITTEKMAIYCNVSVSYLHKLFKTELGVTPGDYLLNCRISAAKDLLANSILPLNEVALRCGFNSQSYFSDCFKRKCGISPSKFRKNTSYLL